MNRSKKMLKNENNTPVYTITLYSTAKHLRLLNPIANIRNVGPWPKHTCELKLYLGKAIQYPIHYYSARHW